MQIRARRAYIYKRKALKALFKEPKCAFLDPWFIFALSSDIMILLDDTAASFPVHVRWIGEDGRARKKRFGIKDRKMRIR